MEVDGCETLNSNSGDSNKFSHLKAFVNAAREFEATHSETAVNLMTRYLGLIASSCDLSIFSPGRSEVCAFFSSLWRVMSDGRGPHWAGIAVLSRACIEPSARHALTHTYKFMPILSRLLSDSISNDKQIKLLSVMQDISYGIKISWQESYLTSLMKQLTDFIMQQMSDPQHRTIGHKSLTVLVNVCYGNLPAIYALMRTVDTKDFVVHLISLKDGGYGGVEVCRLLLCLSGATRGSAATRQPDVHSYLNCTMKTFHKAVLEKDETQLLHAYTFLNDLCTDTNLRSMVLSYSQFGNALLDTLKEVDALFHEVPSDAAEPETSNNCLRNILKFLTVLIGLDLYALRVHHPHLICLCMKASTMCLPEALELFAAVVSQYKDEGRLPPEVLSVLGDGLPALLVPPALEPGKSGLQWLQAVSSLCEQQETVERVVAEVTPDTFEDTLYSVLLYTSQLGTVGADQAQQAVVLGCRVALALAPVRHWDAALNRLLAHHQVRKLLCAGLTSSNGPRRRQILQLVKHHYFPSDQMNKVFGESLQMTEMSSDCSLRECSEAESAWTAAPRLAPAQEHAIDALITRLNDALQENRFSDVATSSVMELYSYKITCLEQRLHSHSVALQGATEQMASLQHSLAMAQAATTHQHEVLYATQTQNEKHKKAIEQLHKQLEDAEATMRGFRVKIAAERVDKENQKELIQKECRQQIINMENELKLKEREIEEKLRQAEAETKSLQRKLDQQTSKNSELAGVLIKFEERVKSRDKRLEEAATCELALKRELEHRDTTIKQLEKTVLERENRIYQLNTQIEEMKRVQEMVAKLMSKGAAQNTPNS
ncbi:hypothetical protein O0L34_g3588 [Tuta absoluta]|nr:hypothetical protein O0L34_g3588 [Tuta absoluta]